MLAKYRSFLLRRFALALAKANPLRWLAEVQLQSAPFGFLFVCPLLMAWVLGFSGMTLIWLGSALFLAMVAGWVYVFVIARTALNSRR